MALHYRQAVPDDVPACIALRGRTRQNAVSAERLSAAGITAATWARDIASHALPGFVCIDGGAIAGYCFGDRASGEVVVLALSPTHEFRGNGRHLLELMVDTLVEAGHRRLFLGCSPDASTRSHGFYRHLGWVSTGTLDANGDEILELHVPA